MLDDSISIKRTQLISDFEVTQAISEIQNSLIEGNNVHDNLSSANHLPTTPDIRNYPTSWASDKGWEAADDSEDETVYLPNTNEDDEELQRSWVGYEDELFKFEKDLQKGSRNTNGFLFDNVSNNQLVMKLGQRFKDGFQFRRALEVQAIRDSIKLCKMDNTSTCISCKCSDLSCDWKITAMKEHATKMFIISDITPVHTCMKHLSKLLWGTKWIAAKFLHKWK